MQEKHDVSDPRCASADTACTLLEARRSVNTHPAFDHACLVSVTARRTSSLYLIRMFGLYAQHLETPREARKPNGSIGRLHTLSVLLQRVRAEADAGEDRSGRVDDLSPAFWAVVRDDPLEVVVAHRAATERRKEEGGRECCVQEERERDCAGLCVDPRET